MARFSLILLFSLIPSAAMPSGLDFNRDVRPVLADHCFECHGPDDGARKADLRLDVPGGIPDTGEVIKRLFTSDEDDVMPPPHSPRQPTTRQREILRRWIQEGAGYETHWSFTKPERPEAPLVSDPSWQTNPIDRFVMRHLQSQGLEPRPEAEPGVLARRLSLALTGLPPLPKDLEKFLAAYDEDPDQAVNDWVERRLATPAYGEHLAWVWLDAARYADTNGFQGDGERTMWPWRDWLIRNLNDNVPFDVLTERMLAGDLLIDHNWESAGWISDDEANQLLLATGFLRNHRYDTGSGTIPAESKFENAADRLETVGTVWMGLTLQCARCHTHKYDPIENREYYKMLSFFDRVPEVGAALKGASHPYIHTPIGKEREKLQRLKEQAEQARADLVSKSSQIDEAQKKWENSLTPSATPNDRVTRGLRHRYAVNLVHFDGLNSIEKTNDPIQLCAGNREWTISFWFRPESKADGAIFSSVEEPERYRPGIQADWIDGRVRMRHVCRWVNSYIEFESTETLEVGQWSHVTFRCDGRMQGLAYRASLNGSDAAMRCAHPVTNDSAGNAGDAPLTLGGSPLLPGFVGALRDLRFYDRELAVAEARSLADPRCTAEIAAIPARERTRTESETLRLAFLESDALPVSIAKRRDTQLTTQAALDEAIRDTPTTMVMQDKLERPTRLRRAGVYDSLGAPVKATTPAFLPALETESPDRLDLARWLVHPDHPLTARVAVNRIWQHLWGRGFVDSPENFGTQTAEPIHADLLDWLATEYIRLGWDTKALIHLVVTSSAYRQSSDAPSEAWTRDPRNRHLARGPRFRLPVHAVRDQALALSGRLDPTLGGPPVILDEVRAKDGAPMRLPYEKTDRRRTLYTFWKRNAPHPMLAVFDVADRNQCDVRATRTNTPLQALVTLNETSLAKSATAFGERARQSSDTEAAQVRWLWRACTGREPDAEDRRLLVKTLSDYRKLTDGDESRAWTLLANVALNLDATLTLE